VLDLEVLAWIRPRLSGPPARVLEVGGGSGELAALLRADGYDVLAIDPEPGSPAVERIALADLDVAPSHFDAAVAVVSLHHIEPLGPSLERLARAVRPGGTLLVDEFDADAFDERAAAWLIERRGAEGHETHTDPAELVAEIRGHLHSLAVMRAELARVGFELEPATHCPYLYRWDLPAHHEADERRRIETGELPAVGRRFAGTRRFG
jgi:SAM-dependent methyltransferase